MPIQVCSSATGSVRKMVSAIRSPLQQVCNIFQLSSNTAHSACFNQPTLNIGSWLQSGMLQPEPREWEFEASAPEVHGNQALLVG
jgi:hypothetical protein